MTSKPASNRILKRTLSSLAAIAAVSAIFGAKAYEVSQHGKPGSSAIAYAEPGTVLSGAD
jgi:hypothetical protein